MMSPDHSIRLFFSNLITDAFNSAPTSLYWVVHVVLFRHLFD